VQPVEPGAKVDLRDDGGQAQRAQRHHVRRVHQVQRRAVAVPQDGPAGKPQ
jgi:hypothetical protein